MYIDNKQVALAIFDGWKLKWQNVGGGQLYDEKPKGRCWPVWIPPSGWYSTPEGKRYMSSHEDSSASPPAYFTSLKAMHALEEKLTDEQAAAYEQLLKSKSTKLWHIDATVRAYCFGKVLNLW